VTGRIAGLGVTVIEAARGDLFVTACDSESQCVGFARKMLKESKLAEPWFVLLRGEKGPLLQESADRSRKTCTLTTTGFVLPDGRTVEIVASYQPAQNNTAMMYQRGFNIGEHL
jgi:hypothetical protein